MSQPLPDDDAVAVFGETYQDAAYYPDAPLERKEEEASDAAIIAASYPIMSDVYDWFQEQIDATDSRRNIVGYANSHGYDITECSRAFDIVRELLEGKQAEFQQFKGDD